MGSDDTIYRRLQQHLDKLPIGFPSTLTGVEKRILKYLFTPEDAELALLLAEPFETVDEIISRNAQNAAVKKDTAELEKKFIEMAKKGLILQRDDGDRKQFAILSLVVGMFELNLKNLTHNFVKEVESYLKQAFALEMMNSQIPQFRTIPIEQSITAENMVLAYDEIGELIKKAKGPFSVANCICKTSHDMDKTNCKKTELRETCLNFGLMGEMYIRNGVGREITREEALRIVKDAEKAGLVIQSMNAKETQVVCACCGCCCGLLAIIKVLPRPADFAASNYQISFDESLCSMCGTCQTRCQMDAIKWKQGQTPNVLLHRCIGCGLCVTTCPTKALTLKPKDKRPPIPEDRTDLYNKIRESKKTRWERVKMIGNILLRREATPKFEFSFPNNPNS